MDPIKSFEITGMTLSGFKCFADNTELTFGNPTVITGGNGQGKSSVADAIAFAITGLPFFGERGIEVLEVRSAACVVAAGVGQCSALVGFQQAGGLVGPADEVANGLRPQVVGVEEAVSPVDVEVDGEREGSGAQHFLHLPVAQDDVVLVVLQHDQLVVKPWRDFQNLILSTVD